jgi:uncharacterized protein YndB with AHSA1/START domain
MTITAVRKDPRSRTVTLETEFDAAPERVWQPWADPRRLARWWARRRTRRRSTRTTCAPAAASSTA